MRIPFSTLLLLTMVLTALADERFAMRVCDEDLDLRKFEFINLFSLFLMVSVWKALCFRCCINFKFLTFSLIKSRFGGASIRRDGKIQIIKFNSNDSESSQKIETGQTKPDERKMNEICC